MKNIRMIILSIVSLNLLFSLEARRRKTQQVKRNYVVELMDMDHFNQERERAFATNKLLALNISMSGCPACEVFEPVFHDMARIHTHDMVFVHTRDGNPQTQDLVDEYATQFPTLVLFKKGRTPFAKAVVYRSVESFEKAIEQFLKEEPRKQPAQKTVPKKDQLKKKTVEVKKSGQVSVIKEIKNKKDFDVLLEQGKKENKKVVIDIYSTTCGACDMYKPTFEKVAQENSNTAIFAQVDGTKDEMRFLRKYIQGYPTTLIYEPGKKEPKKEVGTMPESVLQRLVQ